MTSADGLFCVVVTGSVVVVVPGAAEKTPSNDDAHEPVPPLLTGSSSSRRCTCSVFPAAAFPEIDDDVPEKNDSNKLSPRPDHLTRSWSPQPSRRSAPAARRTAQATTWRSRTRGRGVVRVDDDSARCLVAAGPEDHQRPTRNATMTTHHGHCDTSRSKNAAANRATTNIVRPHDRGGGGGGADVPSSAAAASSPWNGGVVGVRR
mmetsp:Transcript_26926/g.107762  ORF Transcript_26926/g.107762 Transcript_26926/m.107762 type:complete len:205 (-) Transcript_26926:236-850(-)